MQKTFVPLKTRYTEGIWNLYHENDSISRKDLFFTHFVDENYLPPRREFEPLVELFRASVLLSQATTRAFIDSTPARRGGLLANLAGAAFHQRCLEKSRAVLLEGNRRLLRRTQNREICRHIYRKLKANYGKERAHLRHLTWP